MTRNFAILVLISSLFMPLAFAGQVSKVKGANALLDLQGDTASPGDYFFTVGADGKKHGIIQITKVRGEKAIAKVVKGKVDAGMTLLARDSKSAKKSSGSSGGDEKLNARSYWGGMLGFAYDQMTAQTYVQSGGVKVPSTNASMSGVGISATGMFDYEVFPQIWFRGLLGVEGFSSSGGTCVSAGGTCNANIYFVNVDFLARYVFSKGYYRPWVGAGAGLLLPASHNSTALETVVTTNVFQVAGGLDWFLSPRFFIPLSIEYGLLPKSADVTASWVEFRIGVGFPF